MSVAQGGVDKEHTEHRKLLILGMRDHSRWGRSAAMRESGCTASKHLVDRGANQPALGVCTPTHLSVPETQECAAQCCSASLFVADNSINQCTHI